MKHIQTRALDSKGGTPLSELYEDCDFDNWKVLEKDWLVISRLFKLKIEL
jgi:hypothetical protein